MPSQRKYPRVENVRLKKFLKTRNLLLDSKYNFGGYIYKVSTEDFILNNGYSLVCSLLDSMARWANIKNKRPKVFRRKSARR